MITQQTHGREVLRVDAAKSWWVQARPERHYTLVHSLETEALGCSGIQTPFKNNPQMPACVLRGQVGAFLIGLVCIFTVVCFLCFFCWCLLLHFDANVVKTNRVERFS